MFHMKDIQQLIIHLNILNIEKENLRQLIT